MTRSSSLALLVLLLAACSQRPPAELEFSYPPEWQPHQAVWIDLHADELFAVPDSRARLEIVQALAPHVPVKVLSDSDTAEEMLRTFIEEQGLQSADIQVVRHPTPNIAMRDAGPIFLSNGSELAVADFAWTGYGGRHAEDLERGQVANDLADRFGWPVRSSEFSAEGGGLEVNSEVILSFKQHGLRRNPGKNLDEIEAAYLEMYNKKKMIWIENPTLLETPGHKIDNYYGQGADQHIDAFMRFVDERTILVSMIDESEKDNTPIQAHDYEALRKNREQIGAATDANGDPFRIVEIPVPDISQYLFEMTVDENSVADFPGAAVGDEIIVVPVMGYANFLITNGVVLVSEYWREGLPESERRKDERMKEILAEYFPDREIVGIRNAILLNWNGGGIHCQTQQEPNVGGLRG